MSRLSTSIRLPNRCKACASCHDGEAADMGKKMASGQKLKPKPIKGKAGSIPVNVQAANDGANLYLRFSWKQPAGGKFYDLMQWTSKGAKFDGYVADKRVMEGGKGLVEAKGEKKGDEWVVVFTRKLAGGGEGDIALASGKTYNFGFAIHDDHTTGRFHHVSLGYTLGIDAKADISAAKQ